MRKFQTNEPQYAKRCHLFLIWSEKWFYSHSFSQRIQLVAAMTPQLKGENLGKACV